MAKRQREVEERNDTGLLTLMRKLFTGYTVRRGEKYRKTITLRPLHNPSIVIASEAKQSHNTLISHEIAASRHALLAAKGSLAPRNDQNWAKVGVMQRSHVKLNKLR